MASTPSTLIDLHHELAIDASGAAGMDMEASALVRQDHQARADRHPRRRPDPRQGRELVGLRRRRDLRNDDGRPVHRGRRWPACRLGAQRSRAARRVERLDVVATRRRRMTRPMTNIAPILSDANAALLDGWDLGDAIAFGRLIYFHELEPHAAASFHETDAAGAGAPPPTHEGAPAEIPPARSVSIVERNPAPDAAGEGAGAHPETHAAPAPCRHRASAMRTPRTAEGWRSKPPQRGSASGLTRGDSPGALITDRKEPWKPGDHNPWGRR